MTVVLKACYCRECNTVSRHAGIEYFGELIEKINLACNRCGRSDVEPIVRCAACGRSVRESRAAWSEDEEAYYCGECRAKCAGCGRACGEYEYSVDEEGNAWCVMCEGRSGND